MELERESFQAREDKIPNQKESGGCQRFITEGKCSVKVI